MRRSLAPSLAALLLSSLALSCGSAPPPTMQGREGMLSATAVAQVCEQASRAHERPFVVEWDATDLASFEAKASRDTIFVKYEGCKLEVLYRCSDPVTPGVFGSYGTPQFTSGTVQAFEVKNEGELYAKLPLGAAQLAGRVQAGEELKLEYYVSGVATTTRDAIHEDDLRPVAGCAGATHFVWAYNLGAFTLLSAERDAQEAAVGVGDIGAGARRSHEQKSVGAGGRISACESQDQRGCRVPIRLALRGISPGASPSDSAPRPGGAPAPGGDEAAGGGASTQAAKAREHWEDARQKFAQGDGVGCLAGMDRALSFDLRLSDQHAFKNERAICVMASGKCDEGKRDYRAALASADVKRELQDFQLDRDTRNKANEVCPSATADNDADFILRADRELQRAAKVNDAKTCIALIDKITERKKSLLPQIKGAKDFDIMGQAAARAGNDYDIAGKCVISATKKCADGLVQLKKQCKVHDYTGCEDTVAKSWAITMQHLKLDCK